MLAICVKTHFRRSGPFRWKSTLHIIRVLLDPHAHRLPNTTQNATLFRYIYAGNLCFMCDFMCSYTSITIIIPCIPYGYCFYSQCAGSIGHKHLHSSVWPFLRNKRTTKPTSSGVSPWPESSIIIVSYSANVN